MGLKKMTDFVSFDLGELKGVGKVNPNTLICGDCLEAMKYIEDASVNMVLADLPYG